jgi:PPOX class probable F420-dependent enzyme
MKLEPLAEKILAEPLLARLAVVKPDCTPHITPVWYYWDGERLVMSVAKKRFKIKCIKKNPRVAATIDTQTPPYRGVIVEGEAELTEEAVAEVTRQLCERYLPPKEAEESYRELMAVPRYVVRIKPHKIIVWDYSK